MSASPIPHAHLRARVAWWKGASIYQIYPRSFVDSNGDGIGDLPGITSRLDYVASLGVGAIWLSPFFPSPMRDFGYDISDYRNVDKIFGTLADFDALVDRAHGLGLKVIIDQVYSHTSDRHPWFQQSRVSRDNHYADWYVWADAKPDGSPPSNWQSVFGGPAWTWDARRGQYYLHNFLSHQPDLNVHNSVVQDALLDVARFWLDRGVDGFRLDAINYAMHDPTLRDNPPALDNNRPRTRPCDFQQPLFNKSHGDIPRFIERIRRVIDSYPDRFTVAEVGGADAEIEMKRFTSGTTRLHSAYGFNFLYADRLTPALVEHAVTAWPDVDGMGWPSWAFSNHDAPRAVTRWASAEQRASIARMSMLLLACMRGNIFVYQGEELGLPQAEIAFEQLRDPEAIANWPMTLGRDGARTPMPWTSSERQATTSATLATAVPPMPLASAIHPAYEAQPIGSTALAPLAPAMPAVGATQPTPTHSSAQPPASAARPWLPVPAAHLPLAVDAQESDADSQLAYTRRVLALRNRHNALTTGTLQIIESSDAILAFERCTDDESLLCVFNLSTDLRRWKPPDADTWRIIESTHPVSEWTLPGLSGLVAERSR